MEKPIIFSTPMVQAILAGRKTQTRRVIKPQPTKWMDINAFVVKPVPKYQPGDVLWVRETWERLYCSCCDGDDRGECAFEPDENNGCYLYCADGTTLSGDARWHPSIHMPRAATRIFLRVTDVRVERVQDINDEDVGFEGLGFGRLAAYEELWDSLNAKRGFGWDSNPWVWKICFERVDYENLSSL